jgi:PAS domain-containing protein
MANDTEADALEAALQRITTDLDAASQELEATIGLLEERTARMHSCDAVLHTVLEGLDEVVIAIDAEGKVEAWSRGADDAFDVPGQDALGRPLAELLEGEDAGEIMGAIRTLLAANETHEMSVVAEGDVFHLRRLPEPAGGVLIDRRGAGG